MFKAARAVKRSYKFSRFTVQSCTLNGMEDYGQVFIVTQMCSRAVVGKYLLKKIKREKLSYFGLLGMTDNR